MSKQPSEVKKILNELSKQYLGKFFEDKTEPGVFQVLDVIKEPGYVYASNGSKMIKRAISKINVHSLEEVNNREDNAANK
jgi:hypothetical protein